jgi:hypothetical protein
VNFNFWIEPTNHFKDSGKPSTIIPRDAHFYTHFTLIKPVEKFVWHLEVNSVEIDKMQIHLNEKEKGPSEKPADVPKNRPAPEPAGE